MAQVTYSSPLVGRGEELTALADTVLGRAGGAALLGGDAGVGKSRLLDALAGLAADRGVRVLVGHCLELGDAAPPYLPFAELVAGLGPGLADEFPALAPLLPAGSAGGWSERAALLLGLHGAIERAAATGPLLLIVEDVHWADSSTRDALGYLLIRGFTGPVGLVISWRTDDIDRRHPLRRSLAEWTRLPRVGRVVLGPLGDEEMRAILGDLGDPDPAPELLELAGGNPFYAEELHAARSLGATRISDQLTELLAVRLERLTPQARTVARVAALAGHRVGDDLLAAVTGLPRPELEAALRELLDQHVLQTTDTPPGYRVRHALLAATIREELLPGERSRLHGALATALGERPDSAPAEIAEHARQAGDARLAFPALIAAGRRAEESSAPDRAARHYADALELAGRDPALLELTDAPDVDALVISASRAWRAAGDEFRAAELVEDRLARLGEAPIGASGAELQTRADLLMELALAHDVLDVAGQPLERLLAMIGRLDRPSPQRARLRHMAARMAVRIDDFELARSQGEASLAEARELAVPGLAADIETTLARLDDFAGHSEASAETLRSLIARSERAGRQAAELRARYQLARVLARLDDHPDTLTALLALVRRGRELGVATANPHARDGRALAGHFAILTGRWQTADELLAADGAPGVEAAAIRALRLVLDAQRGRTDAALAALTLVRPAWTRDMFVAVHSAVATIDMHGARGDVAAMLAVYADLAAVDGAIWSDRADFWVRAATTTLLRIADLALADPAQAARHREAVARLGSDVDRVRTAYAEGRVPGSGTTPGVELRAWAARADAVRPLLAAIAAGDRVPPPESVEAARASLAEFVAGDIPFEEARARILLADLLERSGDRAGARDERRAALTLAEQLGAGELVARLRPGGTVGPLTARETEVLRLVAAGSTNGQIAERLHISTKTASVHVSNILAKLGAANRSEAAATATRQGLL